MSLFLTLILALSVVAQTSDGTFALPDKFFGRNDSCGSVLKRDLIEFACSYPSPGCDCPEGQTCDENGNCGDNSSPIVIDFSGRGIVELTDKANGVLFDLDFNGEKGRIPWLANTQAGWLVFNFNEDGFIADGYQLFGDLSPQGPEKFPGEGKSGYRALRGFDDDKDNAITPRDGIWRLLGVWRDANHNGISELGEVVELSLAGIESISLDYKQSRRKDRYGNEFRYRAKVRFANGREGTSFDVFLNSN